MRKHLAALRSRAVLVSAGAALLVAGVGFGTAADTPAPTVAAVTTSKPEPAPAVQPAPAVAPTPVATQPTANSASSSYDPSAPFTDSSGTTYQPAPPLVVHKMPGEPGYQPPAR
jgi:hypothetical protein